MKKICILCAGAVRNMVMVSVYTDYLKRQSDYVYDMLYMDKYHEDEETGAENNYRFEYDGSTKIGKFKGYTSFVREASRILSNTKYDFIIVWGEWTAALMSQTLVKNYADKYCINIRDIFVGKRKILNAPLYKAIKNANYVSVSSNKYLEELPRNYNNYVFFHSFNADFMGKIHSQKINLKHEKIRILYIGNIRFYDHLYHLIDEVKNDNRYELYVIGVGSQPIKEYAELNLINNVIVEGAFPKEMTPTYLEKADVIYNLYGTDDINLRMALSNKLYYAVYLYLPILVYSNTYMYNISHECGIGFAYDKVANGKFADEFYEWYQNRDEEEIRKKCDNLIGEAVESQKILLQTLEEGLAVRDAD